MGVKFSQKLNSFRKDMMGLYTLNKVEKIELPQEKQMTKYAISSFNIIILLIVEIYHLFLGE